MIVSASRRTDIPAYYTPWLIHRLHEGFVLVPNPYRPRRFSRVPLNPQAVDAIVFWSKNPAPLLPHLQEIEHMGFPFYIQFTLTPYGPSLEPGLPAKETLIETFRRLSSQVGPQRVDWRYDPIILGGELTLRYHLEQFSALCQKLSGYTTRCIISFFDSYPHLGNRFCEPSPEERRQLAQGLGEIAAAYSLPLSTCSEAGDYRSFGIEPAACIDRQKLEGLLGCPIAARKDPGQRQECGCITSVDIGSYGTCPAGCRYCYATRSYRSSLRAFDQQIPDSPLLCGSLPADAEIAGRDMPSVKANQLSLFSSLP